MKLYVIDNSPNNLARELCRDQRVIYIFNDRNLGFGAAHNIAIDNLIAMSAGGLRVAGSFGSASNGQRIDRILLTSGAGTIVGYGLRLPGETLGQAIMESDPRWSGHISSRADTSVTAYGLYGSERMACPIRSVKLSKEPSFNVAAEREATAL